MLTAARLRRRRGGCAPPASSSPSPAGARRAGWRCWSSRSALTTPIAAFNGGMFVKPDLTTVIEQRTLPLAVATEVVDLLLRRGPRRLGLPRRRLVHPRRRTRPHVAREQATVQFAPTVIARSATACSTAPSRSSASATTRRWWRAARPSCAGAFGAHASAARSQPYYLDVTHPDANKGMVVRDAVAAARRPARADRGDRRHAQRRADVRPRRHEHRDGQRQPRGAAHRPATSPPPTRTKGSRTPSTGSSSGAPARRKYARTTRSSSGLVDARAASQRP